jgi:hypothetical protein
LAISTFFVAEYRQKVASACEGGDKMATSYAAAQLQEELGALMFRLAQGFYPAESDLLGECLAPYREAGFPDLLEPAAQGNLAELARRVDELDAAVRDWLEDRGVALNVLEDVGELRRFLEGRHPR